jgi:ribosome-associated protein
MDIRKLQKIAVAALEDIKAKDIEVINTSKISAMFDRVIIATGDSNRQVKSLAKNVHDKVKEAGGQVIGIEGEEAGEWVLVDLGDIVVHVMQPAVRTYYNLEELWKVVPKRTRKKADRRRRRGMKLIVAAVSQPGRRTGWWPAGPNTRSACRANCRWNCIEIKPEPRSSGKTAASHDGARSDPHRCPVAGPCRRIALDERGEAPTTRQLAERLAKWMAGGDDVAFIIGGPDGLDPRIKNTADETMRLSSLTLPHALVRVILAEALYRAASVIKGHPYHRD